MLEAIRRRRENEEGFTLIELMVVVLIIAILLAIAIPTFLGARKRAQDRAAQSDIRNALAAEKVFYTDEEVYADAATDVLPVIGTTDLLEIEPQLTINTGTTPGGADRDVYVEPRDAVDPADMSAVCVSRTSASAQQWSLLDVAIGVNAGTYYYADGTCNGENGTAAPTGARTGW